MRCSFWFGTGMIGLSVMVIAACGKSERASPPHNGGAGGDADPGTAPPDHGDGAGAPVTPADPDPTAGGDPSAPGGDPGGPAIPPAPYPPPEPPPPAEAPPPPLAPRPPVTATNAPPDPVTVGGPPATCQVHEVAIPIQAQDGVHKPQNSTIVYDHNPPTSGPNYEMWADYRRYTEPILRPHWVHNLRHGAIVLVYRPDAPPSVVQALADALPQIPTAVAKGGNADCPSMGIMTPDPELLDTFAVLARGWMMTGNCAPAAADVKDFATRHIFDGPEKECYPGAFPVRLPCYRFEDSPAFESTYVVPEGTPVAYRHNPPTSGPFYDQTVKYGRYDKVVPAPYWLGIVAKGGVVVLYRPDAPPALIAELKEDFDALPDYWKCHHPMVAMVQDPTLDHYFAYVAGSQYMTAQCTAGWSMYGFVSSRQGWGIDPYVSCDDGNWVPQ